MKTKISGKVIMAMLPGSRKIIMWLISTMLPGYHLRRNPKQHARGAL